MTLIKYNKQNGNRGVAPVFNQLVNEFFDSWNTPAIRNFGGGNLPAVNVSETEKEFKLELVAPGFSKEEISLTVEDGALVISGQHESQSEEKDQRYSRKEFSRQNFRRSFTLPENVDEESIGARFENGIVLISLPKKEEPEKASRKIQLQ